MIASKLRALSVEEAANSLTHGIGLLLSVAGFAFLVILAAIKGDGWHIAGSIVYGASLVILYAASTIYHATTDPVRKKWLQIVDHCCIYLLIAGTYTPFVLVVLRNGLGAGILAVVWTAAIFGIVMKVIFRLRFSAIAIALYLIMGWIGVFVAQPLYLALGTIPLLLVVAGGISYTAGMIFFGWHGLRHHHAVFHLFVLAGSILHFCAVAFYVFA